MLKALLLALVLDGAQGIQMKKVDPPSELSCPDVSDQNNVLFWGMILDGKDHQKGKGAYNWHGFKLAYDSLAFLLTEKTEEPLEFNHLMKARKICCDDSKSGLKRKSYQTFDWAGTNAQMYEGPIFKSYTCLACDHMKALIADVPKEFFKITPGENKNLARSPGGCPDYQSVLLRPKPDAEIQTKFKELIAAYNTDVEKLTAKKDKLVRLAYFLKDYAFLHPWGNGNGRFRALMLNHEVRRLKLGCGTLMYNNNKDLYFITKPVYVEKIEEGIAMYNEAIATGKSPWLDEAVIAKHKKRFDPNITMPGLLNCRDAEYTKTSYYKQKTEEENLDAGEEKDAFA